ncbi:MAG: aminotransferase class IV, partial [Dehalococcoidia bacterium]
SVRLAVSAGSGRAPDFRTASHPLVTVTVDPLAAPFGGERPPLRLAIASVRVDERRPWRGAKVAQYLPYLLARAEATAAPSAATDPLTLSLSKGDDALLLNYAGHIVEAATANAFLVVAGALVTPSLESGPIPGVTRAAVIEVARGLDVTVAEREVAPADLEQASAVFLTSSVAGIVEVTSITGAPPAAPSTLEWRRGEGDPLVARIRQAYLALIERECGA